MAVVELDQVLDGQRLEGRQRGDQGGDQEGLDDSVVVAAGALRATGAADVLAGAIAGALAFFRSGGVVERADLREEVVSVDLAGGPETGGLEAVIGRSAEHERVEEVADADEISELDAVHVRVEELDQQAERGALALKEL